MQQEKNRKEEATALALAMNTTTKETMAECPRMKMKKTMIYGEKMSLIKNKQMGRVEKTVVG